MVVVRQLKWKKNERPTTDSLKRKKREMGASMHFYLKYVGT